MQTLSLGLAVLLIVAYGLGMLFSLKTHRELFGSAEHAEAGEAPWPLGLALVTLAGVTVLVALVSEVFVESVQKAAEAFGMTPAFVGFIVVALVGGAAEMASAFSGARKNRLDLSVGIALGSAAQIALFVAPVLVLLSYVMGPAPMSLEFWPGAVSMMLIATLTATLVTNSGRSAWFVGVLLLMVYLIFAMTLYLLPPQVVMKRALDPIDRLSEVLFGLIMVLTFTGSLSVSEAGREDVRTMLAGCPGLQPGLGDHRRRLLPHGLPGREEPGPRDLPGRARGRRSRAGAAPHRGRAAAGGRVGAGAGGARGDARAAEAAARATRARAAGQGRRGGAPWASFSGCSSPRSRW